MWWQTFFNTGNGTKREKREISAATIARASTLCETISNGGKVQLLKLILMDEKK